MKRVSRSETSTSGSVGEHRGDDSEVARRRLCSGGLVMIYRVVLYLSTM